MKKKKIKILEAIIFITIITTLILTVIISTKVLKEKPELSDSSSTESYEMDKTIYYFKNINDASIYKIPFMELTIEPKYKVEITATDNFIKEYKETIKVPYNTLTPEQNNSLINYCNSYDEIETRYQLDCSQKVNGITLTNIFKIKKLSNHDLYTKKYKLYIPFINGDKLKPYEKILKEKNINYYYK